MRQRDLARAGPVAAADQPGVRDGVVRSAERAGARPAACRRAAGRPPSRRASRPALRRCVMAGRIDGRARASSVLPAPGGPAIRTLCPPAAATSRARLTCSWPLTSRKSGATIGCGARVPPGGLGARDRDYAREVIDKCRQRRHRDHLHPRHERRFGGVFQRDEDAGEALLPRQRRHGQHAAHVAHRSVQRQFTQRDGLLEPFGADLSGGARAPRAIGRSYAGPSLRSAAGARLTVRRPRGNVRPAFLTAACTRSRLS